MIQSALLVLAQQTFVEHRIAPLFCARPQRWLRTHCLRTWRGQCGRRPDAGDAGCSLTSWFRPNPAVR
jgi:hypothetical protein